MTTTTPSSTFLHQLRHSALLMLHGNGSYNGLPDSISTAATTNTALMTSEGQQLEQLYLALRQSHWHRSVLPLTVFLSVLMTLGVAGNGMVLAVLVRTSSFPGLCCAPTAGPARPGRSSGSGSVSVSNVLVLSLAVADLVVCVLAVPGHLARAWFVPWGHDGLCKAWELVRHATLPASSVILVAIAHDRYRLVCRPGYSRGRAPSQRRRTLCATLVAAGVMGAGFGVPAMLDVGVYQRRVKTVGGEGGGNGDGDGGVFYLGLCEVNSLILSKAAMHVYWDVLVTFYIAVLLLLLLAYSAILFGVCRHASSWRRRRSRKVTPQLPAHPHPTATLPAPTSTERKRAWRRGLAHALGQNGPSSETRLGDPTLTDRKRGLAHEQHQRTSSPAARLGDPQPPPLEASELNSADVILRPADSAADREASYRLQGENDQAWKSSEAGESDDTLGSLVFKTEESAQIGEGASMENPNRDTRILRTEILAGQADCTGPPPDWTRSEREVRMIAQGDGDVRNVGPKMVRNNEERIENPADGGVVEGSVNTSEIQHLNRPVTGGSVHCVNGQAGGSHTQVEKVKRKTVESSAHVHGVNRDNAGSSTNIHSVNTETAGSSTNIHSVSRETAESSTNIHSVNTETAGSSTDIHGVNRETAESSTDIHGVNTETAESSTNIDSVNTETAGSSTNIHSVNTETAGSSTYIHGVNRETAESSTDIHGVNRETAESSTNIHSVRRETAESSTNIHSVRRETAESSTDIHGVNRETAESSTNIHSVRRETAGSSTDIHSVNRATEGSSTDIHSVCRESVGSNADVHSVNREMVKSNTDADYVNRDTIESRALTENVRRGTTKKSAILYSAQEETVWIGSSVLSRRHHPRTSVTPQDSFDHLPAHPLPQQHLPSLRSERPPLPPTTTQSSLLSSHRPPPSPPLQRPGPPPATTSPPPAGARRHPDSATPSALPPPPSPSPGQPASRAADDDSNARSDSINARNAPNATDDADRDRHHHHQRHRQSGSSDHVRGPRQYRAHVKTAAMFFLVTFTFLTSYLPTFLMILELVPRHPVLYYSYLLHSAANPLLYSATNANFRASTRQLFARSCRKSL